MRRKRKYLDRVFSHDFSCQLDIFTFTQWQKMENNLTNLLVKNQFEFSVTQPSGQRVRAWAQVFDLHNGSYIARFKLFESYQQLKLTILYNGQNVADSPYYLNGMVYHEKCYCPVPNIDKWFKIMDCPASYDQIDKDLSIFKNVDLDKVAKEAVSRFSSAGMHSLCHYKIINNKCNLSKPDPDEIKYLSKF
ncbi:hypothetical protein KUTeg_019371 [Tegillarca granosa]|uniref:Uncharacterized protein n=1 Tax=Tegillarca granosa TaxID=220873 RepID=A0ABQ9ECT3_TEGGR|nr:hypothetical protein KUTeg_019371 [Tegillarca granosa]